MISDWKEFWNGRADFNMYEGSARPNSFPVWKMISDALTLLQPSAGDVVLDAGCGTGFFTFAFAPLVAQLYAVDYSQPLIDKLSAQVSTILNITLSCNDIVSLPFEDNMFDKVLAYAVIFIEYLGAEEKIDDVVIELLRVTKSGGRVLLGNVGIPETEYIKNIFGWELDLTIFPSSGQHLGGGNDILICKK